MAIALNTVAPKAAVQPVEARGIVAAFKSFLTIFTAALEASQAVNSGRRPSNAVLTRLGVNPDSFPQKFGSQH